MALVAIFRDKYNRPIFLESDLKTERGYINRAKKGKLEYKRVKTIHFYKTSIYSTPYYDPDKKPYKIVEV